MNEKIYTIVVGRGRLNHKTIKVVADESKIADIAMAHYRYSKLTNEFGNPIMVAYQEGESFNFFGGDGVVLIDCM